jgi:prepilin-type N-terminal cleavage/methylation domain-containing protein
MAGAAVLPTKIMRNCYKTIRTRKYNQGFSLVEVLISIFILAIGVTAMIEMFPPGFLAINSADLRSRAHAMASNALGKNASQLANIELIYSYDAPTADNPSWSNDLAWSQSITSSAASYNADVVNGSQSITSGGINSERVVSCEQATIPQLNSSYATQYANATTPYIWASDVNRSLISTPVGSGSCTYGVMLAPVDIAKGVSVRGSAWTPVQVLSYDASSSVIPPAGYVDPTDQLTPNQPQFAIDYTNHRIALPLEQAFANYNDALRKGQTPSAVNNTAATPIPNQSYNQTITITYVVNSSSTGQPVTYQELINWNPTDTPNPTSQSYIRTEDQFYHSAWFDPTAVTTGSVTWIQLGVNGWPVSAATSTPPSDVTGTSIWLPGSVSVKRDFSVSGVSASGASGFTADPYEVVLDTDINASGSGLNAGTLHFNPLAASLRDASNKPVQFAVDYVTADARILSEDHPASGSWIRVDAPSIMAIGDQLDASEVYSTYSKYTGLLDYRWNSPVASSYTVSAPFVDIHVVDLDTGAVLTNKTDYSVNYSAGRIMLLDGSLANSNHRLRVIYRARHEWTVTLLKAAQTYQYAGGASGSPLPIPDNALVCGVRSSTPSNSDSQYLGMYWINPPGVSTAPTTPTILYFPYTDIGKSVELGAVSLNNGTTTQTVAHGGSWTILYSSTGGYGYIDLSISRTADGNPTGIIPKGYYLNYTSAAAPVQSVSGGSAISRVTYYDQSGLHHEEVSSYLNAGGS